MLKAMAWQVTVKVVETHISLIFLVADQAFKLKRAVKLPYVDFSTPTLRLSCCLKEIELNRKTAPELYLRVRRISRSANGTLCLDGTNEMIDADRRNEAVSSRSSLRQNG